METYNFLQYLKSDTGLMLISGLIATLCFLSSMKLMSMMQLNKNKGLAFNMAKAGLLHFSFKVLTVITFISIFLFVMQLIDLLE